MTPKEKEEFEKQFKEAREKATKEISEMSDSERKELMIASRRFQKKIAEQHGDFTK